MTGAEDGGRVLLLSALDCIEFLRSRDGAERGALLGAGDGRAPALGSGITSMTGDVVAEGDMPFLYMFKKKKKKNH